MIHFTLNKKFYNYALKSFLNSYLFIVMDILEIILENIEVKDNKAIRVLIEHYSRQGLQQKSRLLFINCIINFYCKHYLSKNLWLLEEFTRHISEIEKNNKDKELITIHMKAICFLLSAYEYKDHENIINTKLNITEKEKLTIDRILHTSQKEYLDLTEFREILEYDHYILINVLYHNIAYSIYIHDCFAIIRYLIMLKKNDSMIDLIFTIMMKYIENNRIPSDVSTYIIACKDLFYYRITKKHKLERINLLLYAIYVLVQKNVKYQELDEYIPKEDITSKESCRTDYLFVITRYDHDTITTVNIDKEYSKKRERMIKNVNIKDHNCMERSNMDIIKESYGTL